MTSANVSNIPVQVAVSNPAVSKPDATADKNEFMKLMNQSMNDINTTQISQETTKVEKTAPVKVDERRDEIKTVSKNEPVDEKTVTEVKDATEEFGKEIEKAISEELDVSEEEVEAVMENLGMTFLDVTVPTNLAEVVAELTDRDDTVELLLDGDFTEILTQVKDLAQDLQQETGFFLEEISEIVEIPEASIAEFSETLELQETNMVEEQSLVENMTEVDGGEKTLVPEMEGQEDVPATLLETNELDVSSVETAGKQVEVMPQKNASKEIVTNETEKETTTVETEVKISSQEMAEKTDTNNQQDHEQNFDGNDKKQDFFQQHDANVVLNQPEVSFKEQVQVVQTQTGEVVEVREIMDQIVTQARTTITQDTTSMEMILNPEGLGKIFMQVSEKEGNITARIVTENESVKEALESQIIQLKEQLNQNGTKVTSVEVSVGTHEFEKNLEEGQQERNQEAQEQQEKKSRRLNMNSLDELQGLMTEEEELAAKIMRDNGNSVDYTA